MEAIDALGGEPLIVRSSAHDEDTAAASQAGRYASVPLARSADRNEILDAIDLVFDSYSEAHPADEVLLQRYITNVGAAGVISTRVPGNGAPYVTLAIDHQAKSSDAVTSGAGNVTTWYILRGIWPGESNIAVADNPSQTEEIDSSYRTMRAFERVAREVSTLLGHSELQLELLESLDGQVHLLQARPLVLPNHISRVVDAGVRRSVLLAAAQVQDIVDSVSVPRLDGSGLSNPQRSTRGFLSNTTDWNPAEMLGQRPHSLALSLYGYAITDWVWSEQRVAYGYRDVRGRPLIQVLAGQPYVDVVTSLTSFIPKALSVSASERIVDAQVELLKAERTLHASVELDVAMTCADFSLTQRLTDGPLSALSAAEQEILVAALIQITNAGVGRLPQDMSDVAVATSRRLAILSIDDVRERVETLLTEVPLHAALPFAHVARGAFVALAFIRSSREEGLTDEASIAAFMRSLQTISSTMRRDGGLVATGHLSWDDFVARYGHLRPGTYDLRQPTYRDEPDLFLRPFVTDSLSDATRGVVEEQATTSWLFTDDTACTQRLAALGLDFDAVELRRFVGNAIRGRELAKFEYSAWISGILDGALELGAAIGSGADEMMHWDIHDLMALVRDGNPPDHSALEARAHAYSVASLVRLPSTIAAGDDLTCFADPPDLGSFIGEGIVVGAATYDPRPGRAISGIVLVDAADPGYEWLFAHPVQGVISAQGGVNSHLAVRCAELGIPAAIGVGAERMHALREAAVVRLDCRSCTIEMLR